MLLLQDQTVNALYGYLNMHKVEVGDPLPDFTLMNEDGDPVRLLDHRGRPVILFFYPKDFTPGCTKEVCAFRDKYADFHQYEATIFGISNDSPRSHRRFIDRHHLPFSLLTDRGNRLRKALGVPGKLFGLLPGRTTYIIDKDGMIEHIFDSQFNPVSHIREALRVLDKKR
jgi:peroxiredoxin Q/BCP